MRNYPFINGYRRKPIKERDGGKNYGKPCIFCGTGTCGEKWIQYTYMRGDDETARICHFHWKLKDSVIIEQILNHSQPNDNRGKAV